MKKIVYISGIAGINPGTYAGVIDGVHKFPIDGDTSIKILELDEASGTAKLNELKALFPEAVFELQDIVLEPVAQAGN